LVGWIDRWMDALPQYQICSVREAIHRILVTII
jgi:hypothetical protein